MLMLKTSRAAGLLTGAALAFALPHSTAMAQPSAQSAVSTVLGAPAQPKVTAPAAAPTVAPGDGGAIERPLTDNPVLAAAIKAYLARPGYAERFDRVWNGIPGAVRALSALAATDPEEAARQLNHQAWRDDLQQHVSDLWPRSSESIPLGDLQLKLIASDRSVTDFRPYSITTIPVQLGASSEDFSGNWAIAYSAYELDGVNIRIHSSYVVEGGRIIDAPVVVLPAIGGTQTVALPGGGSLVLTLGESPLTAQQIVAWTK